jgi:ribonuclease HI
MIVIYTDGAASGNPGPGGYGVVLRYQEHYKELSAGYRLTTNNRMELLAVITALEALKSPPQQVSIYSDSKYVIEPVEKGWLWRWINTSFKGKKNKDLWLRFVVIYKQHQVSFHWIKGHAGNPDNERCDQLAVMASMSKELLVDEGYENTEDKSGGLF